MQNVGVDDVGVNVLYANWFLNGANVSTANQDAGFEERPRRLPSPSAIAQRN
jgi:hypothetical protein